MAAVHGLPTKLGWKGIKFDDEAALGEYIRLRIDEQTSNVKAKSRAVSLADSVLDPVLQAQIRDKESLARWLRKENDALRSLLKTLRPGVDIDSAIAKASKGGQQLLLAAPSGEACRSNEGLATSLLKLMDHLVGGRQYSFTKGRLTINKKIVLDASEVIAYREASSLSADEWSRRYELSGAADGKR